MINFIIYSSNNNYFENVKTIINRIMFDSNENYKIYYSNNYDINYLKYKNKIYIMDIDSLENDTFKITKEIRENDFESYIFLYSNNPKKWAYDVINCKLIFSLADKKKIKDDLEIMIKLIINKLKKESFICVKEYNIIHKIYLDDILYITKDTLNRSTCIITYNEKITTKMSLSSIKNMLNKDFMSTHRSCIINTNNVKKIDKTNKTITFKNNLKINNLSTRISKKINNL